MRSRLIRSVLTVAMIIAATGGVGSRLGGRPRSGHVHHDHVAQDDDLQVRRGASRSEQLHRLRRHLERRDQSRHRLHLEHPRQRRGIGHLRHGRPGLVRVVLHDRALNPRLTTNCRLRAVPTGTDLDELPRLVLRADPLHHRCGALRCRWARIRVPRSRRAGRRGCRCERRRYVRRRDPGDGSEALDDGRRLHPTGVRGSPLPATNITPSGTATASTVKVDGHNAYLPAGVNSYLISSQSLAVSQTKLTTTSTRAKNGDLTVTESAPLVRCSVDDTYPPTSTSCPALVSTGVTFKRTVDLFRGDHQIRVRDSFVSTGAAHFGDGAVRPGRPPVDTAAPASSTPATAAPPSAPRAGRWSRVSARRRASLLLRSDRYAGTDEPAADTHALNLVRAPVEDPVLEAGANLRDVLFADRGRSGVPPTSGSPTPRTAPRAGVHTLAAQAVGDVMAAPDDRLAQERGVGQGHVHDREGIRLGRRQRPAEDGLGERPQGQADRGRRDQVDVGR